MLQKLSVILIFLFIFSFAVCTETENAKKDLCLKACTLFKKEWQRSLCEMACDQIKNQPESDSELSVKQTISKMMPSFVSKFARDLLTRFMKLSGKTLSDSEADWKIVKFFGGKLLPLLKKMEKNSVKSDLHDYYCQSGVCSVASDHEHHEISPIPSHYNSDTESQPPKDYYCKFHQCDGKDDRKRIFDTPAKEKEHMPMTINHKLLLASDSELHRHYAEGEGDGPVAASDSNFKSGHYAEGEGDGTRTASDSEGIRSHYLHEKRPIYVFSDSQKPGDHYADGGSRGGSRVASDAEIKDHYVDNGGHGRGGSRYASDAEIRDHYVDNGGKKDGSRYASDSEIPKSHYVNYRQGNKGQVIYLSETQIGGDHYADGGKHDGGSRYASDSEVEHPQRNPREHDHRASKEHYFADTEFEIGDFGYHGHWASDEEDN